MKLIVICTNEIQFQNNQILSEKYAKNFVGTLWLSELIKILDPKKYKVITGDLAFSMIKQKKCRVSDMLIIQDLDSKHGEKLTSLGCIPLVLMCFESMLYASNFYLKAKLIAPKFKHRILFSGIFQTFTSKEGINYPATFPSYYNNQLPDVKSWDTKKFITMIVSNKFQDYNKSFPYPSKNILRYAKWLKTKFLKPEYRKFNDYCRKNELHTKRLEIIYYFANKKNFDLYGPNWDNMSNLPDHWQKIFNKNNVISSCYKGSCSNKIKTMSQYKYVICFENLVYPGYITEKIIDCFVAGVVPIYLGAPDIQDHIPKSSFIDMRQFNSFDDLVHHLECDITENDYRKLLQSGKEFLCSTQGNMHSYEGFAASVKTMIES